jgi:uncharacterized membrane protein YqjE
MTPRTWGPEDATALGALLQETAESLGALIADHVKLARIELQTDVRIYARAVGVSLAAGALLVFGYLFAWTALALALARLWGPPAAFAAVAAVHLLVGALSLGAVSRKVERTKLLRESIVEARGSVRALAHSVKGGAS